MPVPIPPPPQLTSDQLRELSAGRDRMKKIRRALAVARFDGWSVGAFGALTLVFGYDSLSGLLIGGALVAAAYVELTWAGKLEKLDVRATRVLAMNQAFLLAAIIIYALWSMWSPDSFLSQLLSTDLSGQDPAIQKMAQSQDLKDVVTSVKYIVYIGLIAISALAQGGLALYYLTRQKVVLSCIQQTSPWVLELIRASSDI